MSSRGRRQLGLFGAADGADGAAVDPELVALAAALPELPYASGLETARLLAADVTRDPLAPRAGAIEVRDVEVDADLLLARAAGPELTRFWLDRLERVSRILEGER